MNICMLAPEFYPAWGGVGTYITELVRHLPKNMQIHVVTPQRESLNKGELLPSEFFRLQFNNNVHIHYISKARETFLYNANFQSACLKFVPKLLKEEHIEIIHSHTAHMPDLLLMFRRLKKPVVTTLHTTIKSQREATRISKRKLKELEHSERATALLYPFLRVAEELYFRQSRYYISPSMWMKKWVMQHTAIKGNLRVIPNSVDTNDFSKQSQPNEEIKNLNFDPQNKHIILYVGRLLALKGVDSLIESIPKVVEYFGKKNLLFIFAGPGDQSRYITRIKKQNLSSCTLFTGPLSRQSTIDMMKLSEILVAPSTMENSPYTILEAMACKKPVIATAVGGIPEIIENRVNGILIEKNSPDRISNAIVEVIKNKQMQEAMGKLASETIDRKFSWAANLSKYKLFYENVISMQ